MALIDGVNNSYDVLALPQDKEQLLFYNCQKAQFPYQRFIDKGYS
jgi:hypothetical protein